MAQKAKPLGQAVPSGWGRQVFDGPVALSQVASDQPFWYSPKEVADPTEKYVSKDGTEWGWFNDQDSGTYRPYRTGNSGGSNDFVNGTITPVEQRSYGTETRGAVPVSTKEKSAILISDGPKLNQTVSQSQGNQPLGNTLDDENKFLRSVGAVLLR